MTEITKENLFDELVKRVKKQLAMIERLEAIMEDNLEDTEVFSQLTKSYNNIVSLYNQTCNNLIQIKKWNYADKDEKEAEIRKIRDLISRQPKAKTEQVDDNESEEQD